MKIIKQSKMPSGTLIQLEDWQEDFSHVKALEIGAYPKAKSTSKSGFIKNNENFRVDLVNFESDEEAKEIFNKLENGKITLKQLREHFFNGKEDEYLLGF